MNFSQALYLLERGEKLYRDDWPYKSDVYIFLYGEDFDVYFAINYDGVNPWTPTQRDLLCHDWHIWGRDEMKVLSDVYMRQHDFLEAMAVVRHNLSVRRRAWSEKDYLMKGVFEGKECMVKTDARDSFDGVIVKDKKYIWTPDQEDFFAKDWEVVQEDD